MKRLEEWNISKRQLGLLIYGNLRAYESKKRWKNDKIKIVKLLDSIDFAKKILDL